MPPRENFEEKKKWCNFVHSRTFFSGSLSQFVCHLCGKISVFKKSFFCMNMLFDQRPAIPYPVACRNSAIWCACHLIHLYISHYFKFIHPIFVMSFMSFVWRNNLHEAF